MSVTKKRKFEWKNKPTNPRRHLSRWKSPPEDQIIDTRHPEEVRIRESVHEQVIQKCEELSQDPYRNCNPRELRDKAMAGDEDALDKLVRLPCEFITVLNEIVAQKPELLRSIARRSSTWPVLGSMSPLVIKNHQAIFEKLELATDVGKVGGWLEKETVITKDTVPKKWAFALLTFIQALQGGWKLISDVAKSGLYQLLNLDADRWMDASIHNLNTFVVMSTPDWPLDCQKFTVALLTETVELPELSDEKEVIDKWWAVAFELLMLNTNGAPQKIPELGDVGACQAPHGSGVKSQSDPTLGDGNYDLDKVEKSIRRKIFTDLKEEFVLIARQLAKVKRAGIEQIPIVDNS